MTQPSLPQDEVPGDCRPGLGRALDFLSPLVFHTIFDSLVPFTHNLCKIYPTWSLTLYVWFGRAVVRTGEKPAAVPFIWRFGWFLDRKSTRLNSSHQIISYAVFCLKKKTHMNVLARLCRLLSQMAVSVRTLALFALSARLGVTAGAHGGSR